VIPQGEAVAVVEIKTPGEIQAMRASGRVVAQILATVRAAARRGPGHARGSAHPRLRTARARPPARPRAGHRDRGVLAQQVEPDAVDPDDQRMA